MYHFDRQRNEIKSYDKSPDSLKAIEGEKVIYKWKFKLDSNHQSSSKFTHIHQIKAVGGTESSMPQITLTTRKRTPDKLELRYAETTSQIPLKQVDLAPFQGVWVEATETILFGEIGTGQYALSIQRVSNSTVLFSYDNPSIRMWKTNADFQRPKWGIYRSLDDSTVLRDEQLLFADFSVEEVDPSALSIETIPAEKVHSMISPNPFNQKLVLSDFAFQHFTSLKISDSLGKVVLTQGIQAKQIDLSVLSNGLYFIQLEGKSFLSEPMKIIKR